MIGMPMTIDTATATFNRPSLARVCVELDLSKENPRKIHILDGDRHVFQEVIYEDLKAFCSKCKKTGHSLSECKVSLNKKVTGKNTWERTAANHKENAKEEWQVVKRKGTKLGTSGGENSKAGPSNSQGDKPSPETEEERAINQASKLICTSSSPEVHGDKDATKPSTETEEERAKYQASKVIGSSSSSEVHRTEEEGTIIQAKGSVTIPEVHNFVEERMVTDAGANQENNNDATVETLNLSSAQGINPQENNEGGKDMAQDTLESSQQLNEDHHHFEEEYSGSLSDSEVQLRNNKANTPDNSFIASQTRLGMDHILASSSNKIWVAWKANSFSLISSEDNGQMLHCLFKLNNSNAYIYLSGVYGAHDEGNRSLLFSDIVEFAKKVGSKPWVLGGDFNAISAADQHKGKSDPNLREIGRFQQCILDSELQESSFTGPPSLGQGLDPMDVSGDS
ncbi:unnamed protein product [Cuscuta campestris]|uniref:DUF4283 domain-containing protein n=1 Tax=Cuscuta campestris TaxID=132261 RepID=A0A484MEA9_9ASTE|nr:unnamed protein product [Cuscuta campestris]